MKSSPELVLNGSNLSVEQLTYIARNPVVEVKCDKKAMRKVARGWDQVSSIASNYKKAFKKEGDSILEYGITTGFGEFKDIPIPPKNLIKLQENILKSHAVGVGETTDKDDPSNYFSPEIIRAALTIRINAFLRGNSGVRPELVKCLADFLNAGIIPLVPLRGSVGSSGDLCPLSHLFVTLLGGGQFYIVKDMQTKLDGFRERKQATDLKAYLKSTPTPIVSYKEGLALTNGATFSAAMLALAIHDAEVLANTSDMAAALTLEALCGCARAFDLKIHTARGLQGQIDSAKNIQQLIKGSKLIEKTCAVQDAYSLRCAPQVHGASRDAIAYARLVVEKEINAATDNPLFFPGEKEAFDHEFDANWKNQVKSYKGTERVSYSGGNFHGQPIALASDFLAIAGSELANISERRTQMLLDSNHNRYLPGNLITRRGIQSGFMIAQYCAASVVSENKVLSHPASVDSIPTSANSEDHVSMAPIAARKLRTVLNNVSSALAIELLAAAQAVDWRIAGNNGQGISPIKKARDLAESKELSGSDTQKSKQSKWSEMEKEHSEFSTRVSLPMHKKQAKEALGNGTSAVYGAIREVVETMIVDRMLDEDIRKVRELIEKKELLHSGFLLKPIHKLEVLLSES